MEENNEKKVSDVFSDETDSQIVDAEENSHFEVLENISDQIAAGNESELSKSLNALHAAEIAQILESLPPAERVQVWNLVDSSLSGDTLVYVNDEVRSGLIKNTTNADLIAATGQLDPDDLVDILPDLPESVIDTLLHAMDAQDRLRLESILQFPADTAGGLMNIDGITIRPDVTLYVVQRYLRFRGQLPDTTDSLFVVSREDTLLGLLPLSDLLTKDPNLLVEDIYRKDITMIPANMESTEVAHIFEKRDLISAPVVSENQRLLGRITIDDVVDVIREDAEHTFLSRAGLDEEDDIFSPVVRSTRRRSIWLGINLMTAILASWVIGLFSGTIEQIVALAVLMPIVASMGGIAGSQTLTLVIRGLALGRVGKTNARKLMNKEVLIGILNGLLWAIIIGIFGYLWFQNVQLGVILGCAIFFNLIVAALAGATIPLILQRFGADPALAGGVVLTTVTDVVGFFVFLGLAATFML